MPNDSCRGVIFHRLFITTSATASFFRFHHHPRCPRGPTRRARRKCTSILFSAHQFRDLLEFSLALLTWYGILAGHDGLRPLFGCSSIEVRARTRDAAAAGFVGLPDAVAAADDPGGGKSGPGTISISSSTSMSGLRMTAMVASTISRKLCGRGCWWPFHRDARRTIDQQNWAAAWAGPRARFPYHHNWAGNRPSAYRCRPAVPGRSSPYGTRCSDRQPPDRHRPTRSCPARR